MQELDDIALLREYAERGSEDAFAALVARHVNKIYSVALWHTGNPHQAEEITQAVFVILARKSRRLGKGVILEGWLYQAARLAALESVRSEIRRARREQEAYMESISRENQPDVWRQIAPLLDKAISTLNKRDQHAVVLRFVYGKSMREVGDVLGWSEGATRLRLHRTMEKLRQFFGKRGILSTSEMLAGAMSAHAVQLAPDGFAKTAAALALAKTPAISSSILALSKGAMKKMAWAKAKMDLAACVAAVLAAGTTFLIVNNMRSHSQAALKANLFTNLKKFMEKNPEEYELTFATTQYPPSEAMKKSMEEYNARAKMKIIIPWDVPVFQKIRRSKDGYFVSTADSLAKIKSARIEDISDDANGISPHGSWLIDNNFLSIEQGKTSRSDGKQTNSWENESEQYIPDALSLGISGRKGSLIWNGTNFTAEASVFSIVPLNQRGKRVITGNILLSNGVPLSIHYDTPSAHCTVEYEYGGLVSKRFGVPSKFKIIAKSRSDGHIICHMIKELYDLNVKRFPPDSTGPEEFVKGSPHLTIIVQGNSGNRKILQRDGKPLTPPEDWNCGFATRIP